MAHRSSHGMNVRAMFRYLSAASLITAAATTGGQTVETHNAQEVLGESFRDFLNRLELEENLSRKRGLVDTLTARVKDCGHPLVEDTTVHLLYRGPARKVTVPSDLNGWSAGVDSMRRIDGTDLFVLSRNADAAARFEYKFVVDSVWILDPFNSRRAFGGYGPNSEIRMPSYQPPEEIQVRPGVPQGRIDTLAFVSNLLKRTHPVFIYLPPGYDESGAIYPSIWVTDGGEYLSLALMNTVMDNLIADGRIQPIVGIFVDPRTDVRNSETSKRMEDYTMNDTFIRALVDELRPVLLKKYRISKAPRDTGIMGASLGGLCATYAAFTQPGIFGLAAAQSPSYWWKERAMIAMLKQSERKDIRLALETGTIADAKEESRAMKQVLDAKGYPVCYSEYPEGHNWVHWRSHIDDLLECFWKRP